MMKTMLLLVALALQASSWTLAKPEDPSNFMTGGVRKLMESLSAVDDIRLTTYSASVPEIGSFQLGGFNFQPSHLSWNGGLELPADASVLIFRTNLNAFLSGYDDLRLTVGELSESYRVVGSVAEHSFQVRLSLTTCMAEIEEVHLTGTRLQIVGEGKLRSLAMVLGEWLEEDYWKKLEAESKKKLAERLTRSLSQTKLCNTH